MPRRPRRTGGPRSRGRVGGRRRACSKPSGSPAAIRSWSATRSRPVTSSVTGCSTWSRVFISRKKTVAAVVEQELARPGARRSRRPARARAPRRSAGARIAGVDRRRRRLLEDLLVAALDRAVALAEMDAVRRGRRTAPGPRRGADPRRSRSRISRSSPNAAAASRRAAGERSRERRRGRGPIRMPLPPPPAAGLTSSG